MNITNWLNLFKQHIDTKIFQVNHLKLMSGLNDHSLRIALSRLAKSKTIKRICRGYYANPFNAPTLEEISAQVYQPSYISLESALSSYGILSQMPRVLTCVTTRLPRVCKTGFGIIEYHQIKGSYFTGFHKQKTYYFAEKEKAVADYLYLMIPKNRRRSLDGLDLSGVHAVKMQAYLKEMGLARDERCEVA